MLKIVKSSKHLILTFCTYLIVFYGSSANANEKTQDPSNTEIGLSFRHIIILQADLKNIWGSYYFAINNPKAQAQPFKTLVMLPKNVLDFRAQEGLTDQDLKLNQDGSLYVEKLFPPGLSLLGVGFQVKTSAFGADTLTFKPSFDLNELSIASPSNMGLKISANDTLFKSAVPPMLANGQYIGIQSRSSIAADQELNIEISGIPKDRNMLWVLGVLVAVILVAFSALLAIKTRELLTKESVQEPQF